MPFTFPDPNVQTEVTNPDTGDVWVYSNGVWMLKDTLDLPVVLPDPLPPVVDYSSLEEEIAALRQEINLLQNDIIGLRTELASVNILTLE